MVGRVYGDAVISRFLLCVAAAASLLAACGGDGDVAAACDAPRAQTVDPRSSQHILPGAPEPPYSTNPPTSGAHAPGVHPTGVVASEIPKPVQVALLEEGQVLLQYGSINGQQRRSLERLADEGNVTVAPNDSLRSPIVATAWLHMMRCVRADQTALQEFIDAHAGKTEGH